MTAWFDRLLHRQTRNPEEYERVRCDLCSGTGIWLGLQPHNATEPNPVHFYRGDHCPRCHGDGWLEVKREIHD